MSDQPINNNPLDTIAQRIYQMSMAIQFAAENFAGLMLASQLASELSEDQKNILAESGRSSAGYAIALFENVQDVNEMSSEILTALNNIKENYNNASQS